MKPLADILNWLRVEYARGRVYAKVDRQVVDAIFRIVANPSQRTPVWPIVRGHIATNNSEDLYDD